MSFPNESVLSIESESPLARLTDLPSRPIQLSIKSDSTNGDDHREDAALSPSPSAVDVSLPGEDVSCEEEESEESGSESESQEAESREPEPAAVAQGSPEPEEVPAEDRPSHVSLLGGKYLLFVNPNPANSTATPPTPAPACPSTTKNIQKCINVETREHYFCKVVPRTAAGLSLLAAYHRLDDFSDCINKIHEIILAPKLIYLIFPLNYGNVHSYLLAKKRLREGEAAQLFKQMVTAVKHCHAKGIVLRDLKLGKFVFLDRERTIIKLESLEDAVLLSDESDDGLSDKHGCPNYVSPEKAEILRSNNKYPGKATDIWGLGVMLYTMIVGRYPFNDTDHAKLFSKIRRGLFTIPELLSHNAKCLIRCLLRREPAGRLGCCEILVHPWVLEEGRGGLRLTPNRISQASVIPSPVSALPVLISSSRAPACSAESMDSDDQVVPVYNPSKA